MSGFNVPDDQSPDEAVFMPGRNPLLLIKPALWCRTHDISHLALATLASNPFRDATSAFFSSFEEMIHEAMDGQIQIARPFEQTSKSRVLEMGRDLPLELTFSCLAPINGLHCGHCNKCAERRRGFREIGLEDRTPYFQNGNGAASPATPISRTSRKQ
jgi:7-cyano-7-deazaguanine synthase